MRVRLLDQYNRFTGESLDEWEASKYIAVLLRRVEDLEGEMLRRGFNESETSYRADQNCVCPVCEKLYIDHPYGGPIVHERQLILHRLCNGDLVKL